MSVSEATIHRIACREGVYYSENEKAAPGVAFYAFTINELNAFVAALTDAAPRMGEAVAWQVRSEFATATTKWWSGWAQMQSEAECVAMVARYKELGVPAEWRALAVIATPAAPRGGEDYAALYNVPLAKLIAANLAPGLRLIYRDAFRWKDARDDGVLPNHYDGRNAAGLASEFGYDVAADLGFAAIIREPHPDTAPAGVRELVGKWRKESANQECKADSEGLTEAQENWHNARSEQLDECADELEQALATRQPAQGGG